MLKKFSVIAFLPLLAACSTTSPEVRLAQHQNQCATYGFKPNTEAYSNCMMQTDLVAKADDRATKDRIRNGLLAMSQSMAPRRPVTCNTFGSATRTYGTTYGNATTTCY